MKYEIDESKLRVLIDKIWDCTCECPPIYDFNNEAYESMCPMYDSDEADCGKCWFDYVTGK